MMHVYFGEIASDRLAVVGKIVDLAVHQTVNNHQSFDLMLPYVIHLKILNLVKRTVCRILKSSEFAIGLVKK